jgi:hypothetical protein
MANGFLARLFDRLRGSGTGDDHQSRLLVSGRIAEGVVLDHQRDELGVTVYYFYYIATVKYETSHRLTPEQLERIAEYIPGKSVTVRYDPNHPGLSILQ